MVTLDQLRTLGKDVMIASVDAEMFGLTGVCSYLGMAFDEIVRVAVGLSEEVSAAEVVVSSVESGEGVSES